MKSNTIKAIILFLVHLRDESLPSLHLQWPRPKGLGLAAKYLEVSLGKALDQHVIVVGPIDVQIVLKSGGVCADRKVFSHVVLSEKG